MSRWIKFFIVIALGLAAGLIYGWAISPVEYTNTTPDTLRADYRSDYVLMVAEVFHADQNVDRPPGDWGCWAASLPPKSPLKRWITLARTISPPPTWPCSRA